MKLGLSSFLVGMIAFTTAQAGVHNPSVAYYGLERLNWQEQPTDYDGDVRIGQYARDPGVGWDSEVLADIDMSGVSGSVTSVKITLSTTNALVGWAYKSFVPKVTVFSQNKSALPAPDSLSYDSFSIDVWDFPLTSKEVTNDLTGDLVLESTPALVSLVQDWIDDPSMNKGLMLTGDFRHHTYFIDFDDIDVEIVTTSTPDPLTTVEKIFGLENVSLWQTGSSDFTVTEDEVIKVSGDQSLRFVAPANIGVPALVSTSFSTSNISGVGSTLTLKVRNNGSFAFPLALNVGEESLNVPVVGVGGGFQTLTYNLPLVVQNLLNGSNSINLRLAVPFNALQAYDFWVDEISIPGAIAE